MQRLGLQRPQEGRVGVRREALVADGVHAQPERRRVVGVVRGRREEVHPGAVAAREREDVADEGGALEAAPRHVLAGEGDEREHLGEDVVRLLALWVLHPDLEQRRELGVGHELEKLGKGLRVVGHLETDGAVDGVALHHVHEQEHERRVRREHVAVVEHHVTVHLAARAVL